MTLATGRRALITGGASGFGLEIARRLVVADARVADDAAAAVLWFLDDTAAFITGVALDVDGGAHLGFLPGA